MWSVNAPKHFGLRRSSHNLSSGAPYAYNRKKACRIQETVRDPIAAFFGHHRCLRNLLQGVTNGDMADASEMTIPLARNRRYV